MSELKEGKTNAEWAKTMRWAADQIINGEYRLDEEELAEALRIGADAILGEGPFLDPLRDPFRAFALACQEKLAKDEVDRGELGWRDDQMRFHFNLMLENAEELSDSIFDYHPFENASTNKIKEKYLLAIADKASEVAKSVMIIFDLAMIDLKKANEEKSEPKTTSEIIDEFIEKWSGDPTKVIKDKANTIAYLVLNENGEEVSAGWSEQDAWDGVDFEDVDAHWVKGQKGNRELFTNENTLLAQENGWRCVACNLIPQTED